MIVEQLLAERERALAAGRMDIVALIDQLLGYLNNGTVTPQSGGGGGGNPPPKPPRP